MMETISDFVRLREFLGEDGKNVCAIVRLEQCGRFLGIFGVFKEDRPEIPPDTASLVVKRLPGNSLGLVSAVFSIGKNIGEEGLMESFLFALDSWGIGGKLEAFDVTEQFRFRDRGQVMAG